MTHICPSCGFNLTADEPVNHGPWSIIPGDGVYYESERVLTRELWTQMMLAIARAEGTRVTTEALLNRVSNSDRNNTIAASMCQLKRHLRDQGIHWPIESRTGASTPGYRWIG